ncbi:hypothetical protein ISCGN_015304 [Ixodes scapularis]
MQTEHQISSSNSNIATQFLKIHHPDSTKRPNTRLRSLTPTKLPGAAEALVKYVTQPADALSQKSGIPRGLAAKKSKPKCTEEARGRGVLPRREIGQSALHAPRSREGNPCVLLSTVKRA